MGDSSPPSNNNANPAKNWVTCNNALFEKRSLPVTEMIGSKSFQRGV
jgi:hypothetical protein